MKNNSLLAILCLVTACITACDKKEILQGKRESISGITVSEKSNISKSLNNEMIIAKNATSLSEHVDISGNKQHVSINHKMKLNTKTLWKTSIGSGPINSDIIAFGGNVYAVDANGILNCISQKNGKIIWKKQIAKQPDEAVFSGGITANNGVIFAGTNIGTVVAIDSKTQKEIWIKKLKYPIKGAPLYFNGKIIVTSIDNQTFALSSSNGSIIWTKTLNREDTMMEESGTPAVSGNDIICAYSSGDILSIDSRNGSDNWNEVLFSTNVSDSGFVLSHISASPVVFGDYILASTSESKTVLLDSLTGIRIWDQNIGTINTPIINNNWIFMLSSNNCITCLSLNNGSIKWEHNIRNYFKDKRYDLYKWTGPLMINGDIVVFSENGDIVKFDISTGKIKFQGIIEKASITRTPIIIDGIMFAITSRAEILAIE